MCYAKPGPRCAGHTKKELAQAYLNYKEAVQESGIYDCFDEKIATDHGVEKPYSSGSYTNQGYNYTQHLTQQQEGITPAINHPGYTDDEPFSFINDWVNR